jgi:hypothetical protein
MASASAADCGYNRALGPARDVGGESGFPDALNDVVDLLRSRTIRHVYDHGNLLIECYPKKTNAAISSRRRRKTLSCV